MINIKVIEKIGEKPGKTAVILAGVHGNEVCGVKAFDNLIPKLKIENGKVYFIYANLEAIKLNKRFIEYNLNRCFLKEQPEEIKETLEGETARKIMPYLDKADVLLDIHASYIQDSISFVICDRKQIKDAKIFDADISSYNWDEFEFGSTDYYMNIQGKPGFCFECGFLENLKTQEIAEKAIKNFLIYSGNVSGKLKLKEKQKVIMIKSLYKNKNSSFKRIRYFPDFEKFKERTLIGKEGDNEIYSNKGDIILFAKDNGNLNEECFLLAEEAEETLINPESLTKSEEDEV